MTGERSKLLSFPFLYWRGRKKRIGYDNFGNKIFDSNLELYLCFGFADSMTDPDRELIHFGARNYQPSTGKWTAKDPILVKGGCNLYGYVSNDPVNRVDRDGQKAFTDYDQSNLEGYPAGVEGYKPLALPLVEQVPVIQTIGNYDPVFDLNHDEQLNEHDVEIFAGNFGKS